MLTVLSLCALASGCDSERTSLAWSVRFEPPELERADSVVVGRALWRGCEGDLLQRWELSRDEPAGGDLELAPGADHIGLSARASDPSCTWYAGGCVEVFLPLPRDETVEVVLRPQDPQLRCPEDECDDGRCGGGDAS